MLSPLAEICGERLFVLQPCAHAAGWREGIGTWLGEFDLTGYARALRAMDLLITIDSMPAHLAGALGMPVWTLLPTDADWRWMEDRDDTPWYPTMRLFRQQNAGDWPGVIRRVADALASWLDEYPATRTDERAPGRMIAPPNHRSS
jgi:ADP-heptose:LPS heptosyltransferase